MALRTYLDRTEKKNAIAICQDILVNFKEDRDLGSNKKKQGLFSVVELDEEWTQNNTKNGN